jgi:hypothetical protein
MLDGAKEACCGHGWRTEPYVVFDDGSERRGQDAIVWLNTNGGAVPPTESAEMTLFVRHEGLVELRKVFVPATGAVTHLAWTNDGVEGERALVDGVLIDLAVGGGTVEWDSIPVFVEGGA